MTDRSEEIREFVDAYNREGIAAALRVFDPDAHWASPPEWMDQSGYEGHEGLRDLDRLWQENFEEFGLTLEDIQRVGELYVVFLHQHGRIKGSGDLITQKVGWVVEYGANGLIASVRAFFSWEETLAAARGES